MYKLTVVRIVILEGNQTMSHNTMTHASNTIKLVLIIPVPYQITKGYFTQQSITYSVVQCPTKRT